MQNKIEEYKRTIEIVSWLITVLLFIYLLCSTLFIKNDFNIFIIVFVFAILNIITVTALFNSDKENEKRFKSKRFPWIFFRRIGRLLIFFLFLFFEIFWGVYVAMPEHAPGLGDKLSYAVVLFGLMFFIILFRFTINKAPYL